MTIFVKDPAASIDYAVDWSAGYLAGQVIGLSTWAVLPDGADAVRIEASSIAGDQTEATISGGTVGTVYRVTNAVTFSDARRDERTLVLRVENR